MYKETDKQTYVEGIFRLKSILGAGLDLAQVWVFLEHHGAGLDVSVLGEQRLPYVDNVVRSTGPKGDQNSTFCRK